MFSSCPPETKHLIQMILTGLMILGPVAFFAAYLVSRWRRHGPQPTQTYLSKTGVTVYKGRWPTRDTR